MKKGTQIVYVPTRASGTDHPDAEPGFVFNSEVRDGSLFCRYWNKHIPTELRTKANSELTPMNMLHVQDTVPQAQVEKAIRRIESEAP